MKKRILLSAFACDPHFGSDEEVGWQWALQLSQRGLDVTVITRRSHKQAIENHVVATGQCSRVKFEYVDCNRLHSILSSFNRRNHIYYYIWQWFAYRVALSLHAKQPFHLIHHVTWVSFRQPSFMGLVGAPMYFGPVAGGDEIPKGYTKSFSINQRLIEVLREIANFFVRYDPLMQMTYRRATQVFFTSEGHLRRVPDFVKSKARIELAIGCDTQVLNKLQLSDTEKRQGNRLLFVGRCIGLKGMDLGLQIFAKVYQERPDVTLTIIGDGVDRVRWMKLAEQLGVVNAIDWRGWLPKEKVLELYSEFDVLFYPSLRDSGGFVVLEALQRGLPVVCFRLGGPGVVVDDYCGAAVEAGPIVEDTVASYAEAVISTLLRVRDDSTLFSNCQKRASEFTWGALITRIYGLNSL